MKSRRRSNQQVSRLGKVRRVFFEQLEDRRVLASVTSGFAAVLYVAAESDDGVSGSLREAIAIANGNQQDDEIYLAEGVYDLTVAGSSENASASGDLDLTEAGKSVTIIGVGAGRSIIDAGHLSDRILEVMAGVNVTLKGVTLRNGSHVVQGGAILNAGNLELQDVVLSNNWSDLGGGIYNASGNLTIINSLLEENVASDGGGILNFDGQATIVDSQILGKSATGSRGQVSAKPLIAAGNGGGLLNVSGSVSLSRSVVASNK